MIYELYLSLYNPKICNNKKYFALLKRIEARKAWKWLSQLKKKSIGHNQKSNAINSLKDNLKHLEVSHE